MSEDPFRTRSKIAWPYAIAGTVIALLAFFYVCFTYVGENEAVIRDCDGTLTLWRSSQDGGFHWTGLCKVEHYPTMRALSLEQRVLSDGVAVKVRGTYIVTLPDDAELLKKLHAGYGSNKRYVDDGVVPIVQTIVREETEKPGWQHLSGNVVQRNAKGALEYAMRRVSPVGIWSAPEARHALGREIQHRLDAATFPVGAKVAFTLGFVTER